MKNRRRKVLIEPRFQTQFILRLTGWVTLSSVITAVIVALVISITSERLTGDFFYVTPQAGAHPEWVSLWQILLPALAVAIPLNLILTTIFSLFYSSRLAGPIFRLEKDILKVARGEKIKLNFHLRDADEFQHVAHAFDTLLKKLGEKGFIREP